VALKTEVDVPAAKVVPSPGPRTVPAPGSCGPSTSTLSKVASSPRVRARRKSVKPESGAWMLRKRARPLPWLVKAWTFPGGTTTAVPGPARCVTRPSVNSSSPSRRKNASVWRSWKWGEAPV
jgi:hypothetical protein